MATVTDLKDELLTQWAAVLAVAGVDNMQETTNKGFAQYELTVNNANGGKDAIGIRNNFVTDDPRQYTIYIRIASQQLPREKAIIAEAVLLIGEFTPEETAFVAQLDALRDLIYADSVAMVTAIGTNMVTRLS